MRASLYLINKDLRHHIVNDPRVLRVARAVTQSPQLSAEALTKALFALSAPPAGELQEVIKAVVKEKDKYLVRDPKLVDALIQKWIMDHPECPEWVIKFATDRPSVFDVLTSEKRYEKRLVERMRMSILMMNDGTSFEKLAPSTFADIEADARRIKRREETDLAWRVKNEERRRKMTKDSDK